MTTMQELSEESNPSSSNGDDEGFFSRLIQVVDDNYPQDWRTWEVEKLSYADLFGNRISSAIEKEIKFAIPPEELYRAYSPDDVTPSNIKYAVIKTKLLNWSLGRALIYAPLSIMQKIHVKSYDAFMCTVKLLKPRLASRKRSLSPDSLPPRRKLCSPSRKRACTQIKTVPTNRQSSLDTTKRDDSFSSEIPINFYEGMMNIITTNMQVMANVANQISNLTTKMNEEASGSNDDSSQSEPSEDSPTRTISGPTNVDTDLGSNEDVNSFFRPFTTVSAPKFAKANPRLVEQGRKIQRFGETGWKKVRYADVQRRFHSTPVFNALQVNPILATHTPSWSFVSQLEKADLTLGAITHGLLQQRAAFVEVCKKFDDRTKREIQKHFLDSSSEFRKISDDLLQYTCGRRAEVIQARRATYRCSDKVMSKLLHGVPPSETHLFSEERLSEVIRAQGGLQHFFPKKSNNQANRNLRSRNSINSRNNRDNGQRNRKQRRDRRT